MMTNGELYVSEHSPDTERTHIGVPAGMEKNHVKQRHSLFTTSELEVLKIFDSKSPKRP